MWRLMKRTTLVGVDDHHLHRFVADDTGVAS
jgi:hypothetical protein